MYQERKATTAEAEVSLLRVLSSTLNTQNEALAEQLRKCRLEHAKASLQRDELKEKLDRRTKALAVVTGLSIVIIALLTIN